MSIVMDKNLSFNSEQLLNVTTKEEEGNGEGFPSMGGHHSSMLSERTMDLVAVSTAAASSLSANLLTAPSTPVVHRESQKKRKKARKLLRKWKQTVKQKLHIADYDTNGGYTNNQSTITSMSELKDALSCYYKFKSDESKIEEMFETMMFKNNGQSPPITRDQELRELVPFEIIGEQKLADLKKKLDVFSNCLSALDDDKPWNQSSGFNSPNDLKAPRSAIGGSGSPPDLVSGISTLDSAEPSESLDKPSCCQLLSGDDCCMNASTDSTPHVGQATGSSKTSSIVEKIASFVRTPKTSETSPMDSVRLSSPLDSEFEVQRLVIPTFRMNAGKNMDVSHIVENLKSGTITENDLLYLASMYAAQEVGFMDKSFYDDGGNEADNESATSDDLEKERQTITTDERDYYKNNHESNDSVKFDRFSYLVIYNASKKCDSSGLKKRSPRNNSGSLIQGTTAVDSGYEGDDDEPHSPNITESDGSLCKSILKSKNNDKEYLESQRAVKCDKVSVDEFLAFFEQYENERRDGEYMLTSARDKQLCNYYSNEYFPEISCQSNPVKATEFTRSKMATEHNIGRELMDVKSEVDSCNCCNECSSVIGVEAN
ncbi:AaceriABL089Wp [[Ashbya] aceris (nom. inval.)]|nr:AaceriABL089Wp [[Ashbya] aceris (nom. inval.)]